MIDSNALIEMMESSFDGVWITDGEGKVLFANSANASLLGVSKAELEGRTTQQLLDEKIFSNSVILEVIRQKKQISKISYNYHTRLTVLATATPIFDDVGNVKYVFNNVRDITALNELQNSLKSKDTIIQQQSRQLESMRIRLGEGTIIANSKAFNEVITLAQRVAAFDGATVLILGESGTGKEIISELIVNNSPRKDWPYLQVNCGAIPENLIESELFGYEKGAFTGADNKGHKGKASACLTAKKVTRVGGTEPIALDVRVIAATNRNLEQMVREGTFREDLYYRLNVVSIFIPPLRERREDIIPLINHFLMVENQKYHTNKSIYSDTIDAFEGYCWPGNVRELENLLENLVITTPGDIIRRENLPLKLRRPQQVSAEEEEETVSLKSVVERAEYAAIERAIEKYGSIRKAAAALDVNPSTITRKMQLYKDMSSRKQNK